MGTINHVLQTLIAAATFRDGLNVAGVVLNETGPRGQDVSLPQNASEIRRLAVPPLLAEIGYQRTAFEPPVDWFDLASPAARRTMSDRQSARRDRRSVGGRSNRARPLRAAIPRTGKSWPPCSRAFADWPPG